MRSSYAFLCQHTKPTIVQIMAYHIFVPNTLSDPMMTYCFFWPLANMTAAFEKYAFVPVSMLNERQSPSIWINTGWHRAKRMCTQTALGFGPALVMSSRRWANDGSTRLDVFYLSDVVYMEMYINFSRWSYQGILVYVLSDIFLWLLSIVCILRNIYVVFYIIGLYCCPPGLLR